MWSADHVQRADLAYDIDSSHNDLITTLQNRPKTSNMIVLYVESDWEEKKVFWKDIFTHLNHKNPQTVRHPIFCSSYF